MLTIKEGYQNDIPLGLIQFLAAEIIYIFELKIKIRVQIIYQNKIGNHLVDFILKTHFNETLDKIQFISMDRIFNHFFIR